MERANIIMMESVDEKEFKCFFCEETFKSSGFKSHQRLFKAITKDFLTICGRKKLRSLKIIGIMNAIK